MGSIRQPAFGSRRNRSNSPKAFGLPKKIALRDGRSATLRFLSPEDSVGELRRFICSLIDEDAKITYDRKPTLSEERAWKKNQLEAFEKGEGYLIVARVGRKFAGNSGAHRERGRGRANICLGLSVAKEFRGIGLGTALLRENIEAAGGFFRPAPRNIYLSVFADNGPAVALYKKLGFRKFAVHPSWLSHRGRFVDHVFMKLMRGRTRAASGTASPPVKTRTGRA